MLDRKLRMGWFSFTCCEDSTMVFIELLNERYSRWKDLIDFRYFRTLKSKNDMTDLDIAFVEGAISNTHEENLAKKVRNNCKKLVAIGSCACSGSPANQRNYFDKSTKEEIQFILDRFGHRDKVSPLSEVIKVDDSVNGCPMDENVFLTKFDRYLREFGVIA
jgi:coenzyme F420-reducing hydrogenase gamma subunit